MSASLYHDCYTPYEGYPNTEYIDGDKRFGDIGVNETLYCLDKDFKLTDLVVTKPFHVSRGHCYISVGKGKNIDFGSCSCRNVTDARNKSVVHYNGCIIGTNEDSVLKVRHRIFKEDTDRLKKILDDLEKKFNEFWTGHRRDNPSN